MWRLSPTSHGDGSRPGQVRTPALGPQLCPERSQTSGAEALLGFTLHHIWGWGKANGSSTYRWSFLWLFISRALSRKEEINFMQKFLFLYPESCLIDAIGWVSFFCGSAGKIPHCLLSRTNKRDAKVHLALCENMSSGPSGASVQLVTTQSHFPEWLV